MIDRSEFLRHFDHFNQSAQREISRQLECGPYKVVIFMFNGLRFVVWRHAPSSYGDGKQGCAAGSTPIWGVGGAQAAWDTLVAMVHADQADAHVDH
jgi:hypothetical protein